MFLRPPAGHPVRRLYVEEQLRFIELNPNYLAEMPTVRQAIQLARKELDKEPRALSFQWLALTNDGHLVLLQVGRQEQRVVWSFGTLDAVPDSKLEPTVQAYDAPNQG